MAKTPGMFRHSRPICKVLSSTPKLPLQIVMGEVCAVHANSCAGQFTVTLDARCVQPRVMKFNICMVMLLLMRTSKFQGSVDRIEAGGVQTRCIADCRREKHLLSAMLSVIDLYKQRRFWRMSVDGGDACPWDHSNPSHNDEWLLRSSDPPILPGPSATESSQRYSSMKELVPPSPSALL